jgi:hypothetical protein
MRSKPPSKPRKALVVWPKIKITAADDAEPFVGQYVVPFAAASVAHPQLR